MLRRMASFPGAQGQWPRLNYSPVRVSISDVVNGFVYILVSLKDKSYKAI